MARLVLTCLLRGCHCLKSLVALLKAQTRAYSVYLHKVTPTWSKDLNVPEQFGFLHNQAVPFYIDTEDGVKLHAWQIVPSGVYEQNQKNILDQGLSGPVSDITKIVNFRLLRDDPEARLVLYMHGTSGTLGSTIRPTSYRNIYSAAPNKIYILTFDYRGFGLSSGIPSERGLLLDALAVVKWATTTAQIPPDRIVAYGQSLGSAVSISLVNYLATQNPSLPFAGVVISASFADLPSLTATYRIGGIIPVLAPIAKIPPLFRFLTSRLQDTWVVKDKIAQFIRHSKNYHLTLIHSEDDSDIPVAHAQELLWHAVNATSATPISFKELEKDKARKKVDLGPGGWYVDWTTQEGTIRLQILKYGEHDWQMTYQTTSSAVLQAFRSRYPEFAP
ncbi:alpha/beta-hydrolase [Mytilinidion resinicola]|uniref:Alpha/beta-hydrolase n=1 Tax=Mytilinidion resinicola TaxID=574789 RepID=A0A6A6Y6Q6_9PEZI|nr:alpha/beta-hydrolase [Mytilinidion resinicola]KAF2803487.1 alpha/beta-hydrolase [Mytilinidion resinicola]